MAGRSASSRWTSSSRARRETPGNPTTFSHPVIYEVVTGADIGSLIGLNTPDSEPAFLAAGRALVEKGVSAIAGNCGLMIVHQAALAKALPVPVLMSSLLQLPLIASMIGPRGTVGIMASSRDNLKIEHLMMATGGAEIPVAIASMNGCPHFREGMASGALDSVKAEAEVVAVAQGLVADNPTVGAILFECVDLPPYAHAVQEATGPARFRHHDVDRLGSVGRCAQAVHGRLLSRYIDFIDHNHHDYQFLK